MWLKISVFLNWSDMCVHPLTGLYVRICVDPSPVGVRCWYSLIGLYVRICDVYMWYCALINYLYVFSNNFKIWLYICVQWFFICLENYIEYFEWNCEIKLVLCLTLFRCILSIIAYWMCGSPHQLQIFRLKFSWGTEPLDCFVRCKVERGSFRWSQ